MIDARARSRLASVSLNGGNATVFDLGRVDRTLDSVGVHSASGRER